MKKINKIFISIALVLILAMPMLAGCSLADLFGGSADKNVSYIEVVGAIKTEYLLNESFNANAATVTVAYDDNSTEQITLQASMTNFDSSTVGKKSLIITYKGITTTVQYRVDKIKLGKFTYRYEGYLSNYSYDKESENANMYMEFKNDDTCIMKGSSSTFEYQWTYNADGNINLTSEVTNVNVTIIAVSSTIVRMESGNPTWIQMFRYVEE